MIRIIFIFVYLVCKGNAENEFCEDRFEIKVFELNGGKNCTLKPLKSSVVARTYDCASQCLYKNDCWMMSVNRLANKKIGCSLFNETSCEGHLVDIEKNVVIYGIRVAGCRNRVTKKHKTTTTTKQPTTTKATTTPKEISTPKVTTTTQAPVCASLSTDKTPTGTAITDVKRISTSPVHENATAYPATCLIGGRCGTGEGTNAYIRILFNSQRYVKRSVLVPEVPMYNIRLQHYDGGWKDLVVFDITECGQKEVIVGKTLYDLKIASRNDGSTPNGRLLFKHIWVYSG